MPKKTRLLAVIFLLFTHCFQNPRKVSDDSSVAPAPAIKQERPGQKGEGLPSSEYLQEVTTGNLKVFYRKSESNNKVKISVNSGDNDSETLKTITLGDSYVVDSNVVQPSMILFRDDGNAMGIESSDDQSSIIIKDYSTVTHDDLKYKKITRVLGKNTVIRVVNLSNELPEKFTYKDSKIPPPFNVTVQMKESSIEGFFEVEEAVELIRISLSVPNSKNLPSGECFAGDQVQVLTPHENSFNFDISTTEKSYFVIEICSQIKSSLSQSLTLTLDASSKYFSKFNLDREDISYSGVALSGNINNVSRLDYRSCKGSEAVDTFFSNGELVSVSKSNFRNLEFCYLNQRIAVAANLSREIMMYVFSTYFETTHLLRGWNGKTLEQHCNNSEVNAHFNISGQFIPFLAYTTKSLKSYAEPSDTILNSKKEKVFERFSDMFNTSESKAKANVLMLSSNIPKDKTTFWAGEDVETGDIRNCNDWTENFSNNSPSFEEAYVYNRYKAPTVGSLKMFGDGATQSIFKNQGQAFSSG